MKHPSFITLSNRKHTRLPKKYRDYDVRFPESLVEYLLKRYTTKGDTILDPFAGYGTTMAVAERMGRIAYGIEFDKERYLFARNRLAHLSRLINGDSLRADCFNIPKVDFSLTSPPYMAKEHKQNPFTAYTTIGDGYRGYLRDIRKIYRNVQRVLKRNAYAIVEISNIKTSDVTPLAWDVAAEISKILPFRGEIVVGWKEGYGFGYDHSYCLVFQNS